MTAPYRILGRYALFDELAAGGMATVHLGRLLGPVGFARTVAVKRLHAQFARDAEFVAMFLDEARLAGRIHHPNVVSTVDVFQAEGELFLVMDYIRGDTLSHLQRSAQNSGGTIPIDVATSIVAGTLYGLHAAHEATNERGEALQIVHRDVSPQNIMLGTDGVPRVLDFGVAKAASRLQSTRGGQLKGKLAYMAPEQLQSAADRRTDVYAASVVLWELLTGRRLFDGDNEAALVLELMRGCQTPPSKIAPAVPRALDEIVMCGLAMRPDQRFATARDMAVALEHAVRPSTARELGEWVERVAGDKLASRLRRVAEIESISAVLPPPGAVDPAAFANTMPSLNQALAAAPMASGRASLASAPSSPSQPSSAGAPPPTPAPWASSGVTSASMVATPPAPNAGKKMVAAWIAGVVAIAAIGVGVVWTLVSSSAPTRSDAASDHGAIVTQVPTPSATATAADPPTAPPASGTSSAAPPVATASATAHAPPPATAKGTATHAAPAKPAKASCDPPFVYDANGVKRYKPECL